MGTGGVGAWKSSLKGVTQLHLLPPLPPLRPQGQGTFAADPSGMEHMQEYVPREGGASETSNKSCRPNTGEDGQAMVFLWLGMSMNWGLDALEGSAGHSD